jgi:hypothetical protein
VNVIYIEFTYQLSTPLNQATVNMRQADTFTPTDNTLVLGFVDIDSAGNILSVDNNSSDGISYGADRSNPVSNIGTSILKEEWPIKMDGNLNANNHKITNLADPEDDLDATNKEYVDNLVASLAIEDKLAKVDVNEKSPDDFSNPGFGWFLDDQIATDVNTFSKPLGTSKNIITDQGTGEKKILITKSNIACKIDSGDSKGIFGGKK